MGDPNVQIAKLLAFPEGVRIADLESIEHDLNVASECFAKIIEGGKSPLRPTTFSGIKDGEMSWPLFVTGLITYRRCFNPGVRNRITLNDLEKILTEPQLQLHKNMIDVADRHIAHQVNAQDMYGVTIFVSFDENDKMRRGSLGRMGHGSGSFALAHFAMMIAVIEIIRLNFISAEKRISEAELTHRLFHMSDKEIEALPQGYPPQSAKRVSFRDRKSVV